MYSNEADVDTSSRAPPVPRLLLEVGSRVDHAAYWAFRTSATEKNKGSDSERGDDWRVHAHNVLPKYFLHCVPMPSAIGAEYKVAYSFFSASFL